MSRDEGANIMAGIGGGRPMKRFGPFKEFDDIDCFFQADFQVSFYDAGRADFIEVSSHLAAMVQFDDHDVFDLPAQDLLALVEKHDQPDPALSDPPNSYIFPQLILSLWERDKQYDYKGKGCRPVFAAIGIGGPSYLAAIRALRKK
jgi:hypothetical protein